jgi:hypothetical protein
MHIVWINLYEFLIRKEFSDKNECILPRTQNGRQDICHGVSGKYLNFVCGDKYTTGHICQNSLIMQLITDINQTSIKPTSNSGIETVKVVDKESFETEVWPCTGTEQNNVAFRSLRSELRKVGTQEELQ